MSAANGIVLGMPHGEYNRVSRVNWSSLKHLSRSPAHYRHQLMQHGADTVARKLGRAVHLATLEPERFASDCAIWTGGVRRGRAWDAFVAANAGRELLKEDEQEHCLAVQAAVRNDAKAAKYLAGGQGEVTMFWTHSVPALGALPGYSMDCKGRIDFKANLGAIVDLKTTRNASPSGFAKEAWNYRYHTQAAYYVDGYEAATGERLPYVIVAVENEAPHMVQVYRVPDHILDVGRDEYRDLLSQLNHCRKNAAWPGYSDGELELELPRWAMDIADDEDVTGLDLAVAQF